MALLTSGSLYNIFYSIINQSTFQYTLRHFRERQTKSYLPFTDTFTNSPRGCNDWDWAQSKIRARNSIQVFLMAGRDPGAWAALDSYPGTLVGNWVKSGAVSFELVPIWDACIAGGNLTYCITMLSPWDSALTSHLTVTGIP